MKAVLVRIEASIYWFDDNGKKHEGAPSRVSGNLSGVYGDLSGVSGNLSRVYGDLSGVSGNLSEAEITDEEREAGIDIADLIKKE